MPLLSGLTKKQGPSLDGGMSAAGSGLSLAGPSAAPSAPPSLGVDTSMHAVPTEQLAADTGVPNPDKAGGPAIMNMVAKMFGQQGSKEPSGADKLDAEKAQSEADSQMQIAKMRSKRMGLE